MFVPTSNSDFRSASGSVNAMQVDKTKTSKLFFMMSSTLYTDKMLSILRELASNGRDSHVEAGKLDTPLVIIAPSVEHPKLVVSDAGTGITYEKAQKTILQFLSSTKDGEDKELADETIGGWGIGAKSPRAYSDNYQVVVRKDGTEWAVQVFNDADGLPQETLLSEHRTDRPDGVDMIVPIETYDIKTWQRKIRTYMAGTNYNIIAYMGEGEVLYPTKPFATIELPGADFKIDVMGEEKRRHESWERPKHIEVAYGGMLYTIPQQFECAKLQEKLQECLKKGLVLRLRYDTPNALRFGLSRETMEVDKGNEARIKRALLMLESDLNLTKRAVGKGYAILKTWPEVVAEREYRQTSEEEALRGARLGPFCGKDESNIGWSVNELSVAEVWKDKLSSGGTVSVPVDSGDSAPVINLLYSETNPLISDWVYALRRAPTLYDEYQGLIYNSPTKNLEDVIGWAQSLQTYKGLRFNIVKVKSTRAVKVSSGGRSRPSYAVCTVTGKQHPFGRTPLVAGSVSDFWLEAFGDKVIVPAKSLFKRDLPEGAIITAKERIEAVVGSAAFMRRFKGWSTDRKLVDMLWKALCVNRAKYKLVTWPDSISKQLNQLHENAEAVYTECSNNCSYVNEYTILHGTQSLPESDMSESVVKLLKDLNYWYVFMERNASRFRYIDFETLKGGLKNGDDEAMRIVYLLNLGEFL